MYYTEDHVHWSYTSCGLCRPLLWGSHICMGTYEGRSWFRLFGENAGCWNSQVKRSICWIPFLYICGHDNWWVQWKYNRFYILIDIVLHPALRFDTLKHTWPQHCLDLAQWLIMTEVHWRHRKVFSQGKFWKNLKSQPLLFKISTTQKQ